MPVNKLQFEKSPYLLQHADNPVNWFPWGTEAFASAKKGRKPIFLSIGYSTCHWCHVMARESFEDETVAALLNREFISIKVDREERPDVDGVYMAAAVAMNGSGGWPLTVLMTPEQKPFYTATYVPKEQLIYLLEQAARLWRHDPEKIRAVGELLTGQLAKEDTAEGAEPGRALIQNGVAQLQRRYDPVWGGFSRAPKFPTPQHLLVLQHSESGAVIFQIFQLQDAFDDINRLLIFEVTHSGCLGCAVGNDQQDRTDDGAEYISGSFLHVRPLECSSKKNAIAVNERWRSNRYSDHPKAG